MLNTEAFAARLRMKPPSAPTLCALVLPAAGAVEAARPLGVRMQKRGSGRGSGGRAGGRARGKGARGGGRGGRGGGRGGAQGGKAREGKGLTKGSGISKNTPSK